MYSSIPLYLLLLKTGFILAFIVLNYCQRLYIHQLFSFPDLYSIKEIIFSV